LVDPKVSKSTKALWTFVKSNQKDHCGVPVLQQDDTGPLITEPHTKANLLKNYFCSVFTKEDGPLPNITE